MMSTWLLQIAMNGLFQSPSPTPVARRRLRWAARESPFLIVSERIFGPFGSVDIGVDPGGRRMGRRRPPRPPPDHSRNPAPIQASRTRAGNGDRHLEDAEPVPFPSVHAGAPRKMACRPRRLRGTRK